jgi:hypothetical protein
MVEATDRNGIFVADFSTERARLGVTKVMRFGRRAATYNAGLPRHEFSVLLVAHADRLADQAASPGPDVLRCLREDVCAV